MTNHRSERRRPVKLQGATIGPFLVDSNRQPFSAIFARQLSAVSHSHQQGAQPNARVANIDPVRIITDEELEAVWADRKPAKAALDTAVSRGNAVLGAKPGLKRVQPF